MADSPAPAAPPAAKPKRYRRVRCSQCQVLVINNVVCHERGCPTQRKKRLILGRWM